MLWGEEMCMTTSILLARLLGPYCVIVALGVLLNIKVYHKVIEDSVKNSAIIYIAGVLALIFGLLIVQFHNVWILDWPLIITMMGWLGLVKGVRLIVFPGSLPQTFEFYQKNPAFLVTRLIVIFLLGLILTVAGYLG